MMSIEGCNPQHSTVAVLAQQPLANEKLFSAAEVQDRVDAALAAQARGQLADVALTLNGYQLKAALEIISCHAGERDQGATEVTLTNYTKGFVAQDDDGSDVDMPAGVYLTYNDDPNNEEGLYQLHDAPAAPDDFGLAQGVYDSLGNEIFSNVLEQLKADPSVQIIVANENFTTCAFPDGSRLVFSGGFAQVLPRRDGAVLPTVLRCTLTGIDEQTDLDRLWALSKQFPFAEWGVLYSDTKAGSGRYPGKAWIMKLCRRIYKPAFDIPSFALHVFGSAIQRLLSDPYDSDVANMARHFGRVQLNMTARSDMIESLVDTIQALSATTRVVLPINVETAWLPEALSPYNLSTVDFLFDSSGGRGEKPEAWPAIPSEYGNFSYAYAGGLGPDNLADELPEIQEANGAGGLAISLEGKLRNAQDVFQVDAAAAVLRICANANFHH